MDWEALRKYKNLMKPTQFLAPLRVERGEATGGPVFGELPPHRATRTAKPLGSTEPCETQAG